MGPKPEIRNLLSFLQNNPAIRSKIRANPNNTLLYAGDFFKPMWKDIADSKRKADPQMLIKETLPEVLERIPVGVGSYANLKDWAIDLDNLSPWHENGFLVWRALSGIFASNAIGTVSFLIGSNVTNVKVFAATEINVLLRNPNIDSVTRDMLEYYSRCVKNKHSSINVGFIAG